MTNGNGKNIRDYQEWSKEELIREIAALKKQKTYGLVWEQERTKEDFDYFINWEGEKTKEEFSPESKDKFPVLAEIQDKEISTKSSDQVNLLIEGDNYHSLAVLNFTHKNSIDIIYIDPPYNTGNNDFKYNDRFVDREDGYRHSKWLSFMSKRLLLAKNLLKESGLLFISIDYNEYAQLKLLCDDILGEENYRNSIILKRGAKNVQAQFDTIDSLGSGYEFILLYSKTSKYRLSKLTRELEEKREGSWNNHWRGTDRPTMRYPLFGIKPERGQWRWSEERSLIAIKNYEKMLNELGKTNEQVTQEEIDGWYEQKINQTEEEIDLLRLSKNGKPEHYIPPTESVLQNDVWLDLPPNSSRLLMKMFGKKVFDNPKPLELIKRILRFSNKNCLILDFFAGSGTTGHAVLELNKEDGGNRTFILCTNNENEICTEVCYPRIKKAIVGYAAPNKEKIEGLDGNLRYFKTDFVDAAPTDKNKRKLVDKCTEMICIKENAFVEIKNGKRYKIFKNNKWHLGIIFDDEYIDDFIKEVEKLDGQIHVYVFSHDDSVPTSEFKTIKNRVTICPIPEVILKVYRKVFKND